MKDTQKQQGNVNPSNNNVKNNIKAKKGGIKSLMSSFLVRCEEYLNEVGGVLATRKFQEGISLASLSTLLFKILFFFSQGTQAMWYISLLSFFTSLLLNLYYDIYGLYIREHIYRFLV